MSRRRETFGRTALLRAVDAAPPVDPWEDNPVPRATEIIDATGEAFGLTRVAILGPSRASWITDARWVAMALVYGLTGMSLPDVAAEFDRDWTTVRHAVARVQNSPQLASWAASIRRDLEAT